MPNVIAEGVPLLVLALVAIVAGSVALVLGRGVRPVLWTCLLLTLGVIVTLTLGSAIGGGARSGQHINLMPWQEIDRGLTNRGSGAWRNVVGNVALFMPWGFAIACLARGGFWARASAGAVTGLLLSTGIEIAQYSLGRVADIDDIILNTTGAMAGGVAGALIASIVMRARRRRARTAAPIEDATA